MVDLKIGYPDIPFNAITMSISNTQAANYPKENTILGPRHNRLRSDANYTGNQLTYDLGSGVTAPVSYFILGGAREIILEAATTSTVLEFQFRASTDNFSASNVTIYNSGAITTADLVGPYSQDLVFTMNETTAYRYWRVIITRFSGTGDFNTQLSKVFFGSFFDFGDRGPRYPYETQYVENDRNFTADASNIFKNRSGKRRRRYAFNWVVTDSVRDDFESKIGKIADITPVFLYTPNTNFKNPLNDTTLVYAWIEDYNITAQGPVKDNNLISVRFVEDAV